MFEAENWVGLCFMSQKFSIFYPTAVTHFTKKKTISVPDMKCRILIDYISISFLAFLRSLHEKRKGPFAKKGSDRKTRFAMLANICPAFWRKALVFCRHVNNNKGGKHVFQVRKGQRRENFGDRIAFREGENILFRTTGKKLHPFLCLVEKWKTFFYAITWVCVQIEWNILAFLQPFLCPSRRPFYHEWLGSRNTGAFADQRRLKWPFRSDMLKVAKWPFSEWVLVQCRKKTSFMASTSSPSSHGMARPLLRPL